MQNVSIFKPFAFDKLHMTDGLFILLDTCSTERGVRNTTVFIINEVLPGTMEMKFFTKQIEDMDSTLMLGEDCKYICDRRLGENICQ